MIEKTLDQEIVRLMLNPDKLYYHCCNDGFVYLDKEKHIKLIDLSRFLFDFTLFDQ